MNSISENNEEGVLYDHICCPYTNTFDILMQGMLVDF